MRDFILTTFLILYMLFTPILAVGIFLILHLPQELALFIAVELTLLLLPLSPKLFSHKHLA